MRRPESRIRTCAQFITGALVAELVLCLDGSGDERE
jgi:hypothetical protein